MKITERIFTTCLRVDLRKDLNSIWFRLSAVALTCIALTVTAEQVGAQLQGSVTPRRLMRLNRIRVPKTRINDNDSQTKGPALETEPAHWSKASEPLGRLKDLEDGTPNLRAIKDGEPDERRFKIKKDAIVTINHEPATLADLKNGDDLVVEKNEEGTITTLEARRIDTGIIVATAIDSLTTTPDGIKSRTFRLAPGTQVSLNGHSAQLSELRPGDDVSVMPNREGDATAVEVERIGLFEKFWLNFKKNLFKPLLLFFYVGFAVPVLRIALEFPKAIYQGLTIYLLISIGWHGGEELATLSSDAFRQALAFIVVGFCTNFVLGLLAYGLLRMLVPRLRKIDAATVAAYYGSDSAGTFVTCLGVLEAAHIAYAAYMPVMLAVMEIPGCLVGLYLVSRMRKNGMDSHGNMPGERRYRAPETATSAAGSSVHLGKVLREVFLNPGLFLLFAGVLVGFASRLQGYKVVQADDQLFVALFQGLLCLFLLEMGMTAAKRLRDLRTASWRFIAFGVLAPNLFAIFGLVTAQLLSHALHQPFQLGTYVLFSVLCAAASYIAVPAIQRIAIPEASPSLPLAASLGLTFSYNVTIGIPVYMVVAEQLMRFFPV